MVEPPRESEDRPMGHVVLAGLRAVGKTTIGKILASSCDLGFVDLDARVLSRFPEATVKECWGKYGEAAWREAEVVSLQEVLSEPACVVALGGGVPTIPAARDLLATQHAVVFWLQAAPRILAARLAAEEGDRPSLTGQSPAEEMAEICQRREADYQAIADHVIDAGHQEPEAIAHAMKSLLLSQG